MFSVRAAVASDQPAIVAIVREARIYSRNLNWARFLVAEAGGEVVGVGQVRQHRDGSRELGSIAVRPAHRGQGVGSAICRALVERECAPLYLICRDELENYYARFGFHTAASHELAPHFRRVARLAITVSRVLRRWGPFELVVMKRGG